MKALNYIKVSPKVAEVWGVKNEYSQLPDGSYLLYWGVPRAQGYDWSDYPQMLKDTGAVILTPQQAKMEQEGLLCITLNEPKMEKYRSDSVISTTPDSESIINETDNNAEKNTPTTDEESNPSNEELNPSDESAIETDEPIEEGGQDE